MSLDLHADIDAMLAGDLGVDVVIGGVSGRGMFDESALLQTASGMQFQQRVTAITVRTGFFPLRDGAAAVVGGVNYLVDAGWEPLDDGMLTTVPLRRVST